MTEDDIKEIIRICYMADDRLVKWFGTEADESLFDEARSIISNFFGGQD